MRALVVMAVCVLGAGHAVADPAAGLDEAAWSSSESAVKSALVTHKNGVRELRRLHWLHLPAFGVTRDDGTAHYAVVAGGKVELSGGKRSDARLRSILRSMRALEQRELAAVDLVFLLHAFGDAPATIRTALDHQTTGRGTIAGHDPALTWSGTGASLVVWGPRTTSRRGAERTPMLRLYKATLAISPSYAFKWNVVSVDEPDMPAP